MFSPAILFLHYSDDFHKKCDCDTAYVDELFANHFLEKGLKSILLCGSSTQSAASVANSISDCESQCTGSMTTTATTTFPFVSNNIDVIGTLKKLQSSLILKELQSCLIAGAVVGAVL